MSLTQFANEFKTDKGTVTGNSHAYTCLYDMLFSGMRELPIKLMEIGLSAGGPELGGSPERAVADAPSLRLWHRYFPKAHIYGVDISDLANSKRTISLSTQDWAIETHWRCGARGRLPATL